MSIHLSQGEPSLTLAKVNQPIRCSRNCLHPGASPLGKGLRKVYGALHIRNRAGLPSGETRKLFPRPRSPSRAEP